jgi:anti-anti-sigma factor
VTLASLPHPSTRTLVFPGFGGPRAGTEATIRVYTVGAWTVLEAAGELSGVVTRGLRELLRSTPSTRVVVDLRRVTFVHHNALAVLARVHRTSRSLGGAVRLVEPPRSVRTLLQVARVYELPPVFATIEEATAVSDPVPAEQSSASVLAESGVATAQPDSYTTGHRS